jgi:hypothetical protein
VPEPQAKGRREAFHRRGAEYAESEDFDKNFFLGALGVSAVRYFRVFKRACLRRGALRARLVISNLVANA